MDRNIRGKEKKEQKTKSKNHHHIFTPTDTHTHRQTDTHTYTQPHTQRTFAHILHIHTSTLSPIYTQRILRKTWQDTEARSKEDTTSGGLSIPRGPGSKPK